VGIVNHFTLIAYYRVPEIAPGTLTADEMIACGDVIVFLGDLGVYSYRPEIELREPFVEPDIPVVMNHYVRNIF